MLLEQRNGKRGGGESPASEIGLTELVIQIILMDCAIPELSSHEMGKRV